MTSRELGERLLPYLKESPMLLGCEPLSLRTRWQSLARTRPGLWMKRDDELSFSMSGSKVRKLWSLSQAIAVQAPKPLVLSWGSQRSAFLLAFQQIALELDWSLELFLLRSTAWQDHGTDQLFKLWMGASPLHWQERSAWAEIETRVRAYADSWTAKGQPVVLIPEGGCCRESLPGAMSLAWEILEQERQQSLFLDSITIEAGSGFTAQALICALGYAERPLHVDVLLCAGDEVSFQQGLEQRLRECESLWGDRPLGLPSFSCHRPATARSYGATNRRVWAALKEFAGRHGGLVDPIYGAKHFDWLLQQPSGNLSRTLWVHSGGALSIFGYPKIPGVGDES